MQARIEENTGAAQNSSKVLWKESFKREMILSELFKKRRKQKYHLQKEEFKIAEQQKALAKQQAIIQAVLNAVQFIGAIANTAAQSGAGTPITLPIVLGTITAGLAAVAGFTKLERWNC